MTSGDRVRHPALGAGVVLGVLARGRVPGARVDFGYMVDWVPQNELAPGGNLRVPGSEDEAPRDDPEHWKPLGTLTESVVGARRAVLALKLGQVLQEDVLDLSVGTEPAEALLRSAVGRAVRRKPAAILVSGRYGAGKTHLLTMLASLAAQEGLATASALLDGEGVTLADPMTILEPVLRSLCLPGESAPSGVGRWLAELRRRGSRWDHGRRQPSRIAAAVFQIPVADLDDPDVLEALEDYLTTSLPVSHANLRLRRLVRQPVQLPAMKAHRIAERAERFCELLRDWAEFCETAGARGLVVVIDEVDVEYAATLWSVGRRRRRQQLLQALNDLLGQPVPLVIAFGSAPATDEEAANDAAQDLTERMSRIQQIDAPRPDSAQMRELGRRLCGLYSRAYPEWGSGVDEGSIERAIDEHARRYAEGYGEPGDPAPRRFVRELLEWLDVAFDQDSMDTDEA